MGCYCYATCFCGCLPETEWWYYYFPLSLEWWLEFWVIYCGSFRGKQPHRQIQSDVPCRSCVSLWFGVNSTKCSFNNITGKVLFFFFPFFFKTCQHWEENDWTFIFGPWTTLLRIKKNCLELKFSFTPLFRLQFQTIPPLLRPSFLCVLFPIATSSKIMTF